MIDDPAFSVKIDPSLPPVDPAEILEAAARVLLSIRAADGDDQEGDEQ